MAFRCPQFLWLVSYSYFNTLSCPVSHRVRIRLCRSLFHFRPCALAPVDAETFFSFILAFKQDSWLLAVSTSHRRVTSDFYLELLGQPDGDHLQAVLD